jgi:hypothetical protein
MNPMLMVAILVISAVPVQLPVAYTRHAVGDRDDKFHSSFSRGSLT